jgi:cytidine deaminase
MNPDDLIHAALRARENAYAPYANFKVGAALLTPSGKVVTGCNVENATYGLTVCAERVALWKAISEGEREFAAIAVVSLSDPPAPPCGACRQLLWEFCGDIEVTVANPDGAKQSFRLADLLPHPFDRRLL